MKASFEVPLIAYCSKCGEHEEFKGLDDFEIARHLQEQGWYIHTSPGGEFRALCAACFIGELRKRFRAHDDQGATAVPEVFRAKRIEIVDDDGKVLLVAQAGPSGGEISVHSPDGTALLAMSASPGGGSLGVADRKGAVIWRAPCQNPHCIIEPA
jgi:hypothetical protein